jgi:small subunit ribosomal protein S2
MLEKGVHFGHRVQEWNPKMQPYIFGVRNGVHIIDLLQTMLCIRDASAVLEQAAAKGDQILLVGTKRQVSNLLVPAVWIAQETIPYQVHYINHRWLGGMLTNWSTMKLCLAKLKNLETRERFGLTNVPKKEASLLRRQRIRLAKYLGGVMHMDSIPQQVIIFGQHEERTAIQECQRLRLNTIGLVDTDCDPDLFNMCIPGNDDSKAAIEWALQILMGAIQTGQMSRLANSSEGDIPSLSQLTLPIARTSLPSDTPIPEIMAKPIRKNQDD